MSPLLDKAKALLREAAQVSFELFKITVPVIILTKILKELGVIAFLGQALAPAMQLVDLPGSMGLVWAMTMITNLYGGAMVFLALPEAATLTVAQATVLGSMMLIAHALPVELRIAQKAGTRFRTMVLIRAGGSMVYGIILSHIYTAGGWLQERSVIFWEPAAADASWGGWALGELRKLLLIFLVVIAVLLVMKTLKAVGFTDLLIRCLEPLLRRLGIGAEAAPLSMIGLLLGISYGGALIIAEAKAGRVSRRDVFFSLALMGLSHSLIEDTLFMITLGGHVTGILLGRLLFSLLAIFLLVKLVSRLSDATCEKYIFRPLADPPAESESAAESENTEN